MSSYPRSDRGPVGDQMAKDWRRDQKNSHTLREIEHGLDRLLDQPQFSRLKVTPKLLAVRAWCRDEQARTVRRWD